MVVHLVLAQIKIVSQIFYVCFVEILQSVIDLGIIFLTPTQKVLKGLDFVPRYVLLLNERLLLLNLILPKLKIRQTPKQRERKSRNVRFQELTLAVVEGSMFDVVEVKSDRVYQHNVIWLLDGRTVVGRE